MMSRVLCALPLLVGLGLAACGSDGGDADDGAADAAVPDAGAACPPVVPPSQTVDFAAPQAVVYAGDYLVVASTNGTYDAAAGKVEFGPGFVSVLEAATGKIVNRIETTATNPQKLVVHGDRLFILNSGGLVAGADGGFVAETPGSIDYLPIDALDHSPRPHGHAELPPQAADPRVGYPVDLAFVGERAYITSGTSNAVFVFNAGNGMLEHGTDDPLLLGDGVRTSLGNITAHDTVLYVTDFNADTLYRIDGADDAVSPCALDLGGSADLEGAGTPRVLGDTLYYLMGVAGVMGHHTLSEVEAAFADPACPALGLTAPLGPLGSFPNTFEPLEDRLYVVESGENQVVAIGTDGQTGATYELPEGSNPFGVAFSADGRHVAVTELVTNGVRVFDRTCEANTWAVEAPAGAMP